MDLAITTFHPLQLLKQLISWKPEQEILLGNQMLLVKDPTAMKTNAPDFLGCAQRKSPLVTVTDVNISVFLQQVFLANFNSCSVILSKYHIN